MYGWGRTLLLKQPVDSSSYQLIDSKRKLCIEGWRKLSEELSKLKDVSVYVIAAVGMSQAGKSMFLSRLDNLVRKGDDGYNANDDKLSSMPFKIGEADGPQTEGIYWDLVLLVDSKLAILLLDVEGSGDLEKPPKHTIPLFTFSLLVSSHVLYLTHNPFLQTSDMDTLSDLVESVSNVRQVAILTEERRPLPKLTIMFRRSKKIDTSKQSISEREKEIQDAFPIYCQDWLPNSLSSKDYGTRLDTVLQSVRDYNNEGVRVFNPLELKSKIEFISDLISSPALFLLQSMATGFVPIGSIVCFAGDTAPKGYLLCDGSVRKRKDYPKLFEVIGTKFDELALDDEFALPDLRDRFIRGSSDTRRCGQKEEDSIKGHSHQIKITADGSGSHSHSIDLEASPNGRHTHSHSLSTETSGGHSHPSSYLIESSGDHSHQLNINIQSAGEHSHEKGSLSTSNHSVAHSHTVDCDTSSAGSHSHQYSYKRGISTAGKGFYVASTSGVAVNDDDLCTAADGDHSHSIDTTTSSTTITHNHYLEGYTNQSGYHTHSVQGKLDNGGTHAHNLRLTIEPQGSHTHSVSGTIDIDDGHRHSLQGPTSIVDSHTHTVVGDIPPGTEEETRPKNISLNMFIRYK